MKSPSRYRWFVVAVFFVFILLHQADKLLISPLITPIMEEFGINEARMGAVTSGALIVGAVFYPVWGYLYDRYARAKLLAAASFIWGATTWLSAIAPNFSLFLVSRASTGVDDSSYPGLYSLIADYFGPRVRGKIFGMLQVAMPLGFMMGMLMAQMLKDQIGWRRVFYITGGLGMVLALIVFFFVKEMPRGQSEPEVAGLDQIGTFRFDWQIARRLVHKKSLLFLFVQGFFGVFPWNVITVWFFRYLETERDYSSEEVTMTMGIAVLVLALGYFTGGAVGDLLFRHTRRGRLIVATSAVLLGAVLLFFTLNVPLENQGAFLILLSATALLIPFSSPNIVSTVNDIALPEVRSTALAVQYFIESGGSALAPWLAGVLAVGSSLREAILIICISAWLLCAAALIVATYLVPRDIETLRRQLRERADAALAHGSFEPEQEGALG